ncbi:MAG: HAMP domain-containing histidine kinase, partial [Schwartzia sp.]|nr:HAMP domain-containing histidine kinase [Schwartzia sp. (in: firmicutes)]
AIMDNFHFYFKDVNVTWRGREYTLHFMRMITAEKQFMNILTNGFFFTNLFGLIIALIAGYFVSKKTLNPIRTVIHTARDIEVSDLSRRIPVPEAEDEMRQLVETINRMLDRLEAGFMQQQRFVSDASHELRTPVTVILGYADMLARWGKDDPETLHEAVEDIRSEATDMRGLIERLLFLARADMKRQVLNKEKIQMDELMESVSKKAAIAAKNHTVTLLKNDLGEIFADGVTIRQMLRVFIENSIKYSPEGTEITLSSERKGDYLDVTVTDHGIGIAPENQKKVFERFFRVDKSRTSGEGGVGGTGLGMAIAQWIADSHDIKLSIESELGKGTTIHMLIPTIENKT